MILMPLVFVTDMERSIDYYQTLGFPVRLRGRNGSWAELDTGGAGLALYTTERPRPWEETAVGLSFVATEPLEAIADRMRAVSHEIRGPVDEAFGRALFVRDPAGILLQIKEHDDELYG